MPEIRKTVSLSDLRYYEMHLSLINCLLPVKMTPMEIIVIASFMSLNGELAQYRFGPTARKKVRELHNLSPGGLSNYIISLTDKGFLKKAGDVTSILPLLIPGEEEQVYQFRLINKKEDSINNININTVETIKID